MQTGCIACVPARHLHLSVFLASFSLVVPSLARLSLTLFRSPASACSHASTSVFLVLSASSFVASLNARIPLALPDRVPPFPSTPLPFPLLSFRLLTFSLARCPLSPRMVLFGFVWRRPTSSARRAPRGRMQSTHRSFARLPRGPDCPWERRGGGGGPFRSTRAGRGAELSAKSRARRRGNGSNAGDAFRVWTLGRQVSNRSGAFRPIPVFFPFFFFKTPSLIPT